MNLTIRRLVVVVCAQMMVAIFPGWVGPHIDVPPVAAEPKPRKVGSDFNGDGYSDLAMNITDSDGEGVDAVVVLYGSGAGLSLSGRQRLVASDFGGRPTKEATRPLGGVMATGDFDGDRYADLILAQLAGRVGGVNDVGAVRVVYGLPAGLNPGRTQLWTQHSRGVPGQAEQYDDFGWSLAVGNFGRGRQDDLAIDVWGEKTAVGESGAWPRSGQTCRSVGGPIDLALPALPGRPGIPEPIRSPTR